MEKHNFLVVLEGEPYEKNECLPLPDDGKIILGRSYGEYKADISFSSLYISRVHAEIQCIDGKYYIRDLSKHGTWLNNTRIEKEKFYELKDGDVIVLGKREAVLVCRLNYEPGQTLDYIEFSQIQIENLVDRTVKDDIIFEKEKRKVKIYNKEYELSGRELKLFEILYENRNKVVSVEDIINYIWPKRAVSERYVVTPEEVRQVVYRLRKRLDPYGNKYIRTVRGEGFLLEVSE